MDSYLRGWLVDRASNGGYWSRESDRASELGSRKGQGQRLEQEGGREGGREGEAAVVVEVSHHFPPGARSLPTMAAAKTSWREASRAAELLARSVWQSAKKE